MASGSPGGADPQLESLFVGQTLGQAIQAESTGGVEGTLWRDGASVRDSAFDNGIIVHEFAHGLTSRLIGGRCNANCLSALQSAGMAEGWSDWYELVMSRKANDRPEDPVSIGTYVVFQPPDGVGLRSIPYSRDQSVNALTYGAMPSRVGAHAIGELWALALWDFYWNLDERYGFDPDPIPGSAGNHLAMQLVTEALSLQPCNPSFIEGRDALLLADEVRGGHNQCEIWQAFTRRGMGPAATSPGGSDSQSVVTDFSLPATCVPEPATPLLRIAALIALGMVSQRSRRPDCA
jgi:extracellular elastinolytic metalloproteinase